MGYHLSKNADHTCPTHSLDQNASTPLFGTTSFYRFNMILSGSCAAFATFFIISLMIMHATHLSKPNEQIKQNHEDCMPYPVLCDILSTHDLFSIFRCVSLSLAGSFSSLALGSFFLLMCELVSESESERDMFFAALVVPDKKAPSGQGGGLDWYRRRWVMIFQYPVVATLAAILADITQAAGVYCQYLSKPYFAHLWISLVLNVSLTLAILSIIRFYFALKSHLAQHKPLAKLLSFKLVVGFTFLLRILWWILTDAKALNPTSTLTYADLNIGIPNLIVCILMVPLSLFFHYAYSCQPYFLSQIVQTTTNGDTPAHYQGGALGFKAWIMILNQAETFRAISFAFSMATKERQTVRSEENMWNEPIQHEQVGYQNDNRYHNKRRDRRRGRRERY